MVNTRLENILAKMQELTKADPSRTIFGAANHQYLFAAPLQESALQDFEKYAKLHLPGDYRAYMNTVSNGGAGPFYGLYPFYKSVEDSIAYYFTDDESDVIEWDKMTYANEKQNLEKYFAGFPVGKKETEEMIRINESYEDDEFRTIPLPERLTGILLLCEYGCGGYYVLVVNGEQAGSVWFLQEDEYLNPCHTKGRQWTFYDFLEWWLNDSILEIKDPDARYANDVSDPLQKIALIYDQQEMKEIPEEVYACINLRKLMFSRNALKEIPLRLFELGELRVLNLYMNAYETIPDAIEKLQNLTVLNLSYSGNLKFLPKSIGKLSKLRKLDLTYCTNLLQLPETTGGLKSLKLLQLSYSGITDLPESVKELSALESLHLNAENFMLNKNIPRIASIPNLKYLSIREQTQMPAEICMLKNIISLSIQNNYASEEPVTMLPPEIVNTNIEELYIAETKYLLPQNMDGFTTLKKLSISPEQMKALPPAVRHLKSLKNIYCDVMNDELDTATKKEIESQLPGVSIRWW